MKNKVLYGKTIEQDIRCSIKYHNNLDIKSVKQYTQNLIDKCTKVILKLLTGPHALYAVLYQKKNQNRKKKI